MYYYLKYSEGNPYLVFTKGLNEAYIDVVDGDAENHNNHILGHSFSEGVSILDDHSHICRRHVHLWMTDNPTKEETNIDKNYMARTLFIHITNL